MYHQTIDTDAAEKLPLSWEAWKMFSFDNHEVLRLDMEPGVERFLNNTGEVTLKILVTKTRKTE